MSAATENTLRAPRPIERELGSYDAGRPGPLLLICAGIHGNEPAGIHAVRRFLAKLHELALPVQGRVEAIAGNLGALAREQRYQARDLNRGWSRDRVDALRRRDPTLDSPEDQEQRAMLAIFEGVDDRREGPLVFVDLHTSSGDSAPFTCTGDTLPNRALALSLPLPLILGLEETIDGAVLDWFNARGHAALAIEGGQHARPETIDNHEACLWVLLSAIGMLPASAVPGRAAHMAHLERSAHGAPPVVEITYRHVVKPEDEFRMQPGFASFDKVVKGQLMGMSAQGPVTAPLTGRVLLPLYQAQGDDGFFAGRDVRPFWLWVARLLRRARFERVVRLLPGVRRAKDDPHTILASRRIARWFLVEVFHLLGYRKERVQGDVLVFTRRYANAQARALPWV
jgi:succinylglutamate desuccinylase